MIPELTLGLRKVVNVPLAIVHNRDNKTTNLLINRDTLSKLGYVIHPSTAHILTKEMEKVKWPNKKYMVKNTIVTIGIILFLSLFFFGINLLVALLKGLR